MRASTLLDVGVENVEVFAGRVDVELVQFVAEGLVGSGFAGLSLERADLPFHFADDVGEAQQVGLGVLELAEGFLLVGLELGDAAGFLENRAPVFGVGAQDLVDAALFHEGVGDGADAGVHEEALDVLQAAGGLVDEVLRLRRSGRRGG